MRWRPVLRRTVDVVVCLLVGAFIALLALDQPRLESSWVLVGVLAGLAQGAALWWRRSHPLVVLAVTMAGGVVTHFVSPEAVFPFAALIALGSVAAHRRPAVSLPALAALLALTSLNFWTALLEDTLFALAVAVVAWALGEVVRNRRAAIVEASRRAAGDERARIARELHDVIAHSVSVIVVQAAAADDVFDEHPDQARTALRSIESAGRDALGELRRLLAAVRPDAEPTTPQPGLDRVGDLAAPLRAAGLDVTVHHADHPALPAGVDLSAYRIVQEALTNTLRHAGASRVDVTIEADARMLTVAVQDDGRGGGVDGTASGRGIAGMRERAGMLGGSLEAGPVPGGGGFRVRAALPIVAP